MNTKDFFNSLADNWDSYEKATKTDLIPYVELAKINSNSKVLDLGCGTGIISGILEDKGCDVTALDLSENMIKKAKEKYQGHKIKFVCGDFYNFEEKNFDHIIIFNAYPHFLRKDDFVKKMYDVLNDNGTFTILHNISRKRLENHHKDCMDVSCNLLNVNEECKYFEKYFEILEIDEGEKLYLIRGKKKNGTI